MKIKKFEELNEKVDVVTFTDIDIKKAIKILNKTYSMCDYIKNGFPSEDELRDLKKEIDTLLKKK